MNLKHWKLKAILNVRRSTGQCKNGRISAFVIVVLNILWLISVNLFCFARLGSLKLKQYQLSSSKGRTIQWVKRCRWSSWARRLPEVELFLLWCQWSRDESSANRGTAWSDAQTFEIRIASRHPPSADTSNRFNENFFYFPLFKSSIW